MNLLAVVLSATAITLAGLGCTNDSREDNLLAALQDADAEGWRASCQCFTQRGSDSEDACVEATIAAYSISDAAIQCQLEAYARHEAAVAASAACWLQARRAYNACHWRNESCDRFTDSMCNDLYHEADCVPFPEPFATEFGACRDL